MGPSPLVQCDSDVMIELLKGNPVIQERIVSKIGLSNVLLSSVTVMELIRGSRNRIDQQAIERRLPPFGVLPVSDGCSNRAEGWIREYALSHNLEIPDAFIGACSVEYALPLYTLNKKDFRYLPGIQLYNPF